MSKIRPFGCEVYYSIHHYKQLGKLDPRCKKGKLVGYDEEIESYRVWDMEEGTIVRSRDVLFPTKPNAAPLEKSIEPMGTEGTGIKDIDNADSGIIVTDTKGPVERESLVSKDICDQEGENIEENLSEVNRE